MTRDEMKKILMLMEMTFNSCHFENKKDAVDAWLFALDGYTFEQVSWALKIYTQTSGSAYAPSPAQLIATLRKPSEMSQMDFITAWRFIRKAISRSLYYSEEEFEKLPEEAQKAIGDPSQLREWAQLPSETIDSVTRSKVESQFNAMQKRNAEMAAMPEEVRELIEKSTPKLPERQIVRAIEAKPEEGGVSESALDSGMDKLKSVLGG